MRDAVLIFADGLAADLGRRRWPRRLAAALALPRLDSAAWDVRVCSPVPLCDRPRWHRQVGRDFGGRLGHAADELADLGYDRVVIVGRDCPDLRRGDVADALAALDAGSRLALGPDDGGGCWLIALNLRDRRLLDGVAWCRGTDFNQLAALADAATLPRKRDLDSTADLRAEPRFHRLLALIDPPRPRPTVAAARRWFLAEVRRLQTPPPALAG